MVPPGPLAAIWKVAVYVKLAELPHVFPAMLSGLTTRSTAATLNGTDVDGGVRFVPDEEPAPLPAVVVLDTVPVVVPLDGLLELLPHAAKLKSARQIKTKLINERFNINFSSKKV